MEGNWWVGKESHSDDYLGGLLTRCVAFSARRRRRSTCTKKLKKGRNGVINCGASADSTWLSTSSPLSASAV